MQSYACAKGNTMSETPKSLIVAYEATLKGLSYPLFLGWLFLMLALKTETLTLMGKETLTLMLVLK